MTSPSLTFSPIGWNFSYNAWMKPGTRGSRPLCDASEFSLPWKSSLVSVLQVGLAAPRRKKMKVSRRCTHPHAFSAPLCSICVPQLGRPDPQERRVVAWSLRRWKSRDKGPRAGIWSRTRLCCDHLFFIRTYVRIRKRFQHIYTYVYINGLISLSNWNRISVEICLPPISFFQSAGRTKSFFLLMFS